MANSTVTLTFEVREDGSLVKVQQNIGKASKAVKDLGAAQAAAAKQADDHYSKQNKGVIGTANSTRSFSKLAQTIGDGDAGLVGAYAGLAANAFALSAAFTVLNNAAQSQSILEGLTVQGERAGKTLTVLSAKLKAITRDAISSTEAMQAVTLGASAGISSEDLEKITEVATNASLALGRNIPDSLNRMTLAITKMEPELVDELGLTTKITEASERYARQNNITVASMTQAQRQQALLNAWVEQGTLKYEGLKDAVDPNPYEKLAATFKDLTTTGLQIINFFLDPFITLLGNSQGALLGLGAIFLSSIRGQVMPGITGVSAAALKEAETAKKIAIDALSSEKSLASGKRKAINEYIEASKEGIATTAQFEAARKESNDRIAAAEAAGKREKKPFSAETVTKITDAELKRQEQLTKIQQENAKASKAQAQAAGYAASEGVTLTNATSKLKDTVNGTTQAYTASYNANRKMEGGFKGFVNTVSSGAQGIAAAGKVAAVGFLNFLPIIGQVIAAITILWELIGKDIWAYLTGRTKEVSAALDAFNTTIESTSGKLKAYEKIQLSTASASDRAAASISNQMSTVYEIADAYTAVIKAVEERGKAEQNQISRAKESRTIMQEMAAAQRAGDKEAIKAIQERQRAAAVADRLGVSAGSNAARAFAAQSSEIWMDDEYVAAAQALEQLEKAMPGVADNFYAINGGVEEFNKLEVDEKLKLINDQLEKTAKVTRNVESAFKALSQAVSGLNTGYIDFIKSITPSTPYDGIVGNLEGVRKGILDTEIAIGDLAAVGGNTEELRNRLSESLTGIEGPARNIFDPATRGALDYFDTLDRRTQNAKIQLEGMNESQAGYADKQREVNDLEGERNKVLDSTSRLVQTGLLDYQKLVTNAQVESITRQGTLALAQAHLKVLQKQGQVTGEDVARQMRAENAIIELQATQIEAQIALLRIDLDREKAALRMIEANQELLRLFEKQTDQNRLTVIETEIASSKALMTSLEGRTDPNSLRLAAEAQSRLQVAEGAKTNLAQQQARTNAEAEQARNAIRVREAQIKSLADEAKALRMGQNTRAEIVNAELKKNLENERDLNALKRESNEIISNTLQMQREMSRALDISTANIEGQASALEIQSALRRTALEEEFDTREKILDADIQLARVRGNASQVKYYTDILNAERERNTAQLQQLTVETNRGKIQLASIKNIEEENSLRKASLELSQKLLEAENSNRQAVAENIQALDRLNRKRAGAVDTPAYNERREIEAAQAAYDLASREIEGKVALIQLEFQLIEAKRVFMISEMNQRAAILRQEADRLKGEEEERARRRGEAVAATPTAPETAQDTTAAGATDIVVTARTPEKPASERAADQAKILEDASAALGAITTENVGKARDAAVNAARTGLDTLRLKLEEALTPGRRVTDGFVARFNSMKDMVDTFRERADAAAASRADNDPNTNIPDPSKVALATDIIKGHFDSLRESFQALGPQGEIAIAVMDSAINISNSFQDAFATMADSGASAGERVAAVAQAVSSIISGIQSITSAASKARIAAIDKEIEAESKRDGKSAASVAKLEALEKKKDNIARKQFNLNKKLMLAQAVMSTAAGVAGALAAPFGLGIPLAILVGAMGAAQIALIAGTTYESSYSPKAVTAPSNLSIGKRSDTVDLASGPNANAGGEVGFIRGSQGSGSNASNYRTIGSAYGGELMRGYGNRGFVVGEKGPEVITPDTPITVTPANDVSGAQPINASFNIHAIDSQGVQDVLVAQKGNIIKMLREAANASGKSFMEDVNVNVYTRPSVGKL
jgi:hypothetical protein